MVVNIKKNDQPLKMNTLINRLKANDIGRVEELDVAEFKSRS